MAGSVIRRAWEVRWWVSCTWASLNPLYTSKRAAQKRASAWRRKYGFDVQVRERKLRVEV